MMQSEQRHLLWVTVKVESGIPVSVDPYWDRESAEKEAQAFRKQTNPDNDEVGVFAVPINPMIS